MTAAGGVYFAESRNINCGSDAALWRYRLGGSRTKLWSFPRRHDTSTTSPLVHDDGSTTLYYDNIRCHAGISDIVKSDIFRLSLGP